MSAPAARSGDPASGTLAPDAVAGRAAARLARVVENALAEVDLSLPQYRMLAFLEELGSSAASALAGKLGVSRPSVTALVDGLVARGLAERTADTTDRRRVAHVITPKGRDALASADRAVTSRLDGVAEKIADANDREVAYAGLALWLGAMNAAREEKLADQ